MKCRSNVFHEPRPLAIARCDLMGSTFVLLLVKSLLLATMRGSNVIVNECARTARLCHVTASTRVAWRHSNP